MKVPVLLPKILDYPLTYKSNLSKKLKVGDLVIVPFGRKKEIGVVWNKLETTNKKINLRNIIEKINDYSINESVIKFINWFSLYNLTSKGMILKMCLGDKNNILKQEVFEKLLVKKKKKYLLNNEQKKALNFIDKKGNNFKVIVLQGVTGSGKTLVYFEKIQKVLKENKQALVMLPEIFLTNQFKDRFLDFFGFLPAIWHSKISLKQKRLVWQGLIKNKINLVIGARSSLALPFKKLGLIVVDEEHDASYKQEEGLIYNARDMAISRASFENIPVLLSTSIPSLETFNHIKEKKYSHIKLIKRFNNFPLPDTKIINLQLEKLKNEYIANETLEIVNQYLEKGNQVLFFLNRRGYAPFLICKNCGYKHTCSNCSIYLTYHKTLNQIICHHCGLKKNITRICKDEKNNCHFTMYGPGVEKVYEEIKGKFPNMNTKIFSSDYLNKKINQQKMFKDIDDNKINILVGTQMISKGFNFENLNCIVVVDADFSGKGFDLRTTEKNIQLYNQLSGRAGRFSKKSIIIYQTITPKHETLKDLIENDPEKFLENELDIRKKNKLPPFFRLIAIIISSVDKDLSQKGAQEIKSKLINISELEVLGPVDSPIFKVKKMFRTRLLLRSKSSHLIQKKLSITLKNLKISSRIKLTVDVDPINFS